MTVGLLFIWDRGWFVPQIEYNMWMDLAIAYNVDLVIMIPDLKFSTKNSIGFESYDSIENALSSHPELTKVFLEPKDIADNNNVPSESLTTFDHPKDALYIFGNSAVSNIGFVDVNNDKVVYVPTINQHQIWSIQVASIVLYDRSKKEWLI